ncbi:MAG: DUF3592 domain-containing protein [Bacteroidota bacterium]
MSTETPSPGPQERTPGQKILYYSLVAVFFVGIPGLLVYMNLSVFLWPSYGDAESEDCIRTQALVTRKAEFYIKYQSKYQITYAFQIGENEFGQRYYIDEQVESSLADRYEEGDSIRICYDANDPEKAIIIGNSKPGEAPFWIIFIDVLVVGYIVYAIYKTRKDRKRAT